MDLRFAICDLWLELQIPLRARRSYSLLRYSGGGSGWGPIANRTTRKRVPQIANPRAAFTLTEILIVIALIVLMLALAVPALNIIRGSRSTDSAQNQVAAMLGHARADAIGLQKAHGIMFFIDPLTQRVNVAEVTEADYPAGGDRDVYLDLVPDVDFLPLPQGVLAFVLANGTSNAGGRTSDGYLGYNVVTTGGNAAVQLGGVILFDAYGRLISRTYGYGTRSNGQATPMQFLISNNYANRTDQSKVTGVGNGVDFVDAGQPNASYAAPLTPPTSALGFALFDDQKFKGAGDGLSDPMFTGNPYSTDQGEEGWIDDNSSQVIINRYNGTLTQAR